MLLHVYEITQYDQNLFMAYKITQQTPTKTK